MQSITVASTGIEIAYETFGAPGGRPLLLVMGHGAQMLAWHPELCAALVAEDFFVVRYDNRDVGLSTHLHDARPPDLDAAMAGDSSSASCRLEDMADDAVGLLDALGLDQAHVVGASLGGMIAQTIAHQAPRPGPQPHLHDVHPVVRHWITHRSGPGRLIHLVHATTDNSRGGGGAGGSYLEDHRITRLPDGRGPGP
jgi:pimeloyl-ACP methyl ester carboxylesterase